MSDCWHLCWPDVSLQFQFKICLHLQNSLRPCFNLFLWPSSQLFSHLPLLSSRSSPLSCPLFWLEHISSCLQLWAFLPKVNTALCYLSISLSVILSMALVFVLAVDTSLPGHLPPPPSTCFILRDPFVFAVIILIVLSAWDQSTEPSGWYRKQGIFTILN